MDPLTAISTRATPQSAAADARQIPNHAGGYGFPVDDATRVRRFLTLGTDGGTYYTGERELTAQTAGWILGCARDRARWLTEQIVAISVAGRAPRPNPALFALAAAASLGDDDGRRAALDALPQVARTGTHLFQFARYAEQFRGWGRGLRRAVGGWYLARDVDGLAYQAVKYRQREGWSHRDLLRLAHPVTQDPARREVFEWIVRGSGSQIPLLRAYATAQATTDVATWVALVTQHPLTWEMLPDAALAEPAVWAAMIERGLPQTALMRQLPRLTRLGLFARRGPLRRTVVDQLQDRERLLKARVHPVNVLVAQRTYALGRSARGSGEWAPVRQIVDALDGAFYRSFAAVEPAGRRTLIALDVSGSMAWVPPGWAASPRDLSAALSLVTVATEPDTTTIGFSTQLIELALSPRQRLDDAIRTVSGLPFGGTDCALPMVWARENRLEFDTFVVFTDNETWAGAVHPHQALRAYRESMGISARLIVVGLTATEVSIADPADPGMLDVAGFDSALPSLIADFSRGEV